MQTKLNLRSTSTLHTKPIPILKGSSPGDAVGFIDGDGNAFKDVDAVFPIVKQTEDGSILLVGTGFFICTHSIFVTATHVLRDVFDHRTGEQIEPLYIARFCDNNEYLFVPIVASWDDDVADISIGVAAGVRHNLTGEVLQNKFLVVTLRLPEVQERAATYAYPRFFQNKADNNQELHFFPEFYEGHVLQYFPEGRDRILMPWPCFRTNIHLHGGSSGGPVFDAFGNVFGVNCRSMDPDTDISFVTPIDNILSGQLDSIRFSETEIPKQVSIMELIERRLIVVDLNIHRRF